MRQVRPLRIRKASDSVDASAQHEDAPHPPKVSASPL
jgi:hypothetical protein